MEESKQAAASQYYYQVEAPSHFGKSTSMQDTTVGNANITRIDRELYKAAMEGNLEELKDVENMESLLTPQKNTILHIHITSRPHQQFINQQFINEVLNKCEALLLLPNAKRETLLHIAARYGFPNTTEFLIERAKALSNHQDIENGSIGAEKELIRATNSEGDTALHEAVRYDHIEVVKVLLKMDPDYSYYPNNANETPLFLASERNYKDIMKEISKNVKSPAYEGPNGRTALHAAVLNCDKETVEDLLANEHVRGAVQHADKNGWVPLHYAVKIGDKHLTELLLQQDRNTAYMQDNEGRTALHVAAYSCHDLIMEMIIEYYPDCSEIVDNKGRNALHYAVNGKDNIFTVGVIISNLALSNLYNEKDVDGNTPLHHLANSGESAVRFVYHPRVDKLATNKKDQTPLDVASDNSADSDTIL